jgi:ADP-ribosyl-[dinitrogen reductase] hydrolase
MSWVSEVGARVGTSGYVVESVPLALSAARKIVHCPLEDVLRSAIEAGGDTDTIATMAGHLAGSWCGASQIPARLVQSLPNSQDIESIAGELSNLIEHPS